jgi:hypothetical protein
LGAASYPEYVAVAANPDGISVVAWDEELEADASLSASFSVRLLNQ